MLHDISLGSKQKPASGVLSRVSALVLAGLAAVACNATAPQLRTPVRAPATEGRDARGTSSRAIAHDHAQDVTAPAEDDEGTHEGPLATPPDWLRIAPYIDSIAVGTRLVVEEDWALDEFADDDALLVIRIRTRPEDSAAALASAERYLVEHADELAYSASRTAIAGQINGRTVRASTPMLFDGELWIQVAGVAPADAVRAGCTGREPWLTELAALAGWSDRVRACSRKTSSNAPATETIELLGDRRTASAWLAQAGFTRARGDDCPVNQCSQRQSGVPALANLSDDGELLVTLNPTDEE